MVSTNSVIPKETYSTFWNKSRILYSYSDLPFLLMSASEQPPEKVGRHRTYHHRSEHSVSVTSGRDFKRAEALLFGSLIPHGIDPIAVPNELIRCDERTVELPGAGNNCFDGGITDGSKGDGFEQYFNRVRLHLKICGTIQLFRPPAKRNR